MYLVTGAAVPAAATLANFSGINGLLWTVFGLIVLAAVVVLAWKGAGIHEVLGTLAVIVVLAGIAGVAANAESISDIGPTVVNFLLGN